MPSSDRHYHLDFMSYGAKTFGSRYSSPVDVSIEMGKMVMTFFPNSLLQQDIDLADWQLFNEAVLRDIVENEEEEDDYDEDEKGWYMIFPPKDDFPIHIILKPCDLYCFDATHN